MVGVQLKTFDDYLNEQLKDEEFRKEYESFQPEMDVMRAILNARQSQNLNQKELAKITGINKADLSKLETGTRNPTINLLKRLAHGLGLSLKIEFQHHRFYLLHILSSVFFLPINSLLFYLFHIQYKMGCYLKDEHIHNIHYPPLYFPL